MDHAICRLPPDGEEGGGGQPGQNGAEAPFSCVSRSLAFAGYTLKSRLVAFSEPPSETTWLENVPIQAASGFASFSIATVMRAFTGAKALSASFTEAS